MIAGLINYLDRSALSIANKPISDEMHLTASQMGLLLSAFSLPYAFAQLPIGVMLDRLGARVMLGAGMLIWSVAQAAAGFVHSLNQFIVTRLLLGVGEGPQFPAGAKVFGEWFALHERGRPTGIFVASTTIAPGLAPPLLTAMMLGFGWRGMFIVMGALGILASIAWYALYRDRRDVALSEEELDYLSSGKRSADDERRMTSAEWRGLFTKGITWGMIIGWMGVIYMVFLYVTWLPAYLQKERGLSLTESGWILMIPFIGGTLGQLSSGFVADGLLARGLSPINSRKWPICIGLVFAAVFTVPAAYTPNLTLAILYLTLAMYFVNLASGGGWALVSVAAPRRLVASLGSIQNFGGYFGGSAAPLITGIVVDQTGSFVNALLISAGVSLAGALAYLLLVKEPIPDTPAEALPASA
ncbi:MFS transporter [Sphingomonas quercus]|uniref:MFS transporter n=1 Tax=Sphingomonas quercus TaxID=2842451 RepID=A0ABS6BL76_9SPHN|nr:MFS transporter [Sphingomonas quercus]